mgnify:CR=1 FL=1
MSREEVVKVYAQILHIRALDSPFFLAFYNEVRYILYNEVRYIELDRRWLYMELTDKIRRVYLPMTETGFYILFCLQKEGHGYSITQKVKEMTDSQVSISPGTMYGTLSKMEKDGLISFVREEEKRKIYQITDLGRKVLEIELKRIERLYRNSREEG